MKTATVKQVTYRNVTTEQLKKAMTGTIAGHEAGNDRKKLIAACKKSGQTPEWILREY